TQGSRARHGRPPCAPGEAACRRGALETRGHPWRTPLPAEPWNFSCGRGIPCRRARSRTVSNLKKQSEGAAPMQYRGKLPAVFAIATAFDFEVATLSADGLTVQLEGGRVAVFRPEAG